MNDQVSENDLQEYAKIHAPILSYYINKLIKDVFPEDKIPLARINPENYQVSVPSFNITLDPIPIPQKNPNSYVNGWQLSIEKTIHLYPNEPDLTELVPIKSSNNLLQLTKDAIQLIFNAIVDSLLENEAESQYNQSLHLEDRA